MQINKGDLKSNTHLEKDRFLYWKKIGTVNQLRKLYMKCKSNATWRKGVVYKIQEH